MELADRTGRIVPATAQDGGRWRVLIADDDADIHPLLDLIIGLDDRFEVVGHAADGAEVLDLVDTVHPDAVVIDLCMAAGMDGWAAIPELRRRLPAAAIVAISAYPDPLSLLQVLSAGGDDYLNKASAWELVPVLGEFLGRRMAYGGVERRTG